MVVPVHTAIAPPLPAKPLGGAAIDLHDPPLAEGVKRAPSARYDAPDPLEPIPPQTIISFVVVDQTATGCRRAEGAPTVVVAVHVELAGS